MFLQLSKQLLPGQDPGTNPTTEINAPNSFRVQAKLGLGSQFTAGVQLVLLSNGSAR